MGYVIELQDPLEVLSWMQSKFFGKLKKSLAPPPPMGEGGRGENKVSLLVEYEVRTQDYWDFLV